MSLLTSTAAAVKQARCVVPFSGLVSGSGSSGMPAYSSTLRRSDGPDDELLAFLKSDNVVAGQDVAGWRILKARDEGWPWSNGHPDSNKVDSTRCYVSARPCFVRFVIRLCSLCSWMARSGGMEG